MDIQSRKYDLIQAIIQLKDITVLEKLEHLLKQESPVADDWWNTIPSSEKEAINQGIDQLDRGESVSHEEVRKRINAKLIFTYEPDINAEDV